MLEYLKSCPSLPRIIGAKGELEMHTWVDASYATHQDMRGHTGGASYMGRDMVCPWKYEAKVEHQKVHGVQSGGHK